jgi:hypothetical protein
MRFSCLVAAAIACILPLSVDARPGGGGGRGGTFGGGRGFDGDEVPPPTWAASVESALGQQPKPVIVYVSPPLETDRNLPGAFRNPEVSRASRGSAVFVRIPFKVGDATLKKYRVRQAPCLIGLDWYGNEWHRTARLSQNIVKEYIRLIPEEVARYEDSLELTLARAKTYEEKEDVRGALRIYKQVALEEKKGFAAIATARDRLKSLGGLAVGDAVALASDPKTEKKGLQALTGLQRDLNGTVIGAWAELSLLKHGMAEASDLRRRIPKIQKIAGMEEEEYGEVATAAKGLLEQIEGYGQIRLDDALRKAGRGQVNEARDLLRQIMGDFPGLKVSERAKEELTKF